MRVLMVTPSYSPAKGGTETVVRNLSIMLNRKHIQTDVLTFNTDQCRNPKWQGKIERNDNFSVFKIPALNLLHVVRSDRITMQVNFFPGRFTSLLNNYDVIHFHEMDFSFPFFSFMVRKPKLLHFHGIYAEYLRMHHLSRTLMKHLSDYYISISQHMTEQLIDLGINSHDIVYIPNGVDISLFKPCGQKADNLLLYVGRVNPSKGLHILVKSLRYLKKCVHLVIIGPIDKPWQTNILKLVEDENQRGQHKITYLGVMNNFDTIEWYQKATIFVLPSFYEGFPVTILEALACQTPVIATPVGGVPEVIKDHKTGILTPPNNPVALAESIQYLLDNKDVRNRYGFEGRRTVVKNYSLEEAVEKLIKIYKQIES